ncbi:MAG TPA: transaldolase [Candidatus Margulisiibacteriota bacterium]|nr:transaldolase [Candidatus Margulisiibacteriota bacterium]
MNPLRGLQEYGQSVWLDYIRRDLLENGDLQRLIGEDGLRGMTSNPAIFEKAIADSTLYDAAFASTPTQHADTTTRYEHVAIDDIRRAADILRPVYDATQRRDGYVSLEVSPYLAHDTERTLTEARRLWSAVGRENVMIKVPGTPEGIPAFEQLISEGLNINVTLLFAQEVYERVAAAYLAGLEKRAVAGKDLRHVASVASFFISRIDTLVDARLSERLKTAEGGERDRVQALFGTVANANGKLTYERYSRIFSGPRWEKLQRQGAQTQRVLWASTSTKNPNYRDVIYVEELIGPDTVNTMPPATIDAFRNHGRLRHSLTENVAGARATMEQLAQVGISMQEVTAQLLDDGVRLFAEAFDKLLRAVEQKSATVARRASA